MATKGSSTGTGHHLRSLREERRRILRDRRPENYCSDCNSVTFDEETQCLQCTIARPESGWPPLSETNDAWLGRIIDGRYLVARPLGQGASADVYRAESLSISRQFAIKIISTDKGQAQAEQIISRLNREIEALSRLRNPHIVSFYEILDLEGKYVAAIMDLIDGHTLEALVVEGNPLGISRACSLLRQIANGLYEAHQAGMIHRDLKPENLMVERLPAGDDFVHILDFGIVRLTDDSSVSMTHGFIGTPLYASPEQAMAKDIDHRCDIYSLGAILFFMLTGRPPFVSNNVYDVLRMHVRQAPPRLGEADPTRLFPEALELLTARMLAKDPSQRPADLSIVIEELDRFTNSHLSDAKLHTNSTHIGGVDDSHPNSNHTPMGLKSTSSARDKDKIQKQEQDNPFREHAPTSGATIQSFGKRKKAETPVFKDSNTPSTDERLAAIPGQIRFQSTGDESSAATSIPTASFSLSVSASQVQATPGTDGIFAILEDRTPPEVQLFRPDSSSPKPIPIPTQSSVSSIALSKKHIIAGHKDGIISRLDLKGGKSRTLFQDVRRTPISAVALDTNDRCIVAGSESGRVYLHHSDRSSSSDWSRIRSGEGVQSIAINQSADMVAIARKDNSVEIISLSNLRIPTGQFRVRAPIRSMAISPDDYLLAAALVDRSVALFQLPTGHQLLSLQAPNVDVLTVEFSKDYKPVAVCAVDGQIQVLEFEEIGDMTRSR